MAQWEKIVDLYFTDDGDFALGDDGDFADTKLAAYRGLVQMINTRLSSSKGEWALEPEVGAGLSGFRGKPNTERIARQIKQRVSSELLADNLLTTGSFLIDVMPVGPETIAIVVLVYPPSVGGQITLAYTYDLRENRFIPRNS